MKICAYIATSLDGFIARPDGGLDWLPQPVEGGEDYGYNRFFASIDAIVMGRNTFDTVISFGEWAYGSKRFFVLSSRPLQQLPDFVPVVVERRACKPSELADELRELGVQRVYVDGGKTIQSFLRAGLLDEITLTTIPVLIGQGISLFGALGADVKLELAESRAFEDGLVQDRYIVVKG
jgi:dihydrofolate reductase